MSISNFVRSLIGLKPKPELSLDEQIKLAELERIRKTTPSFRNFMLKAAGWIGGFVLVYVVFQGALTLWVLGFNVFHTRTKEEVALDNIGELQAKAAIIAEDAKYNFSQALDREIDDDIKAGYCRAFVDDYELLRGYIVATTLDTSMTEEEEAQQQQAGYNGIGLLQSLSDKSIYGGLIYEVKGKYFLRPAAKAFLRERGYREFSKNCPSTQKVDNRFYYPSKGLPDNKDITPEQESYGQQAKAIAKSMLPLWKQIVALRPRQGEVSPLCPTLLTQYQVVRDNIKNTKLQYGMTTDNAIDTQYRPAEDSMKVLDNLAKVGIYGQGNWGEIYINKSARQFMNGRFEMVVRMYCPSEKPAL